MSCSEVIFMLGMMGIFISCILYVVFGQITVRKLRKNPETKSNLGVELASGWDIFNVASALTAPKWFKNKYSKSPISFLAANYEMLYKYTTGFDRALGRTFWVIYVASGALMILFAVLQLFD